MGITISLPVLTAEQRQQLLAHFTVHDGREAELKRVAAEATERGGEEIERQESQVGRSGGTDA